MLNNFMQPLEAQSMDTPPLDILDVEIRSERTLEEVKRASSRLS